jgi:hypothetical protein
MNALEQIAVDEGLFAARMVLQMTGLKLQIKVLEREIGELKDRIKALEAGEHR